ncbi:hypothetical protein J7643_14050 [bacterium]|nr:hypothetical protein [bacterium]
MSNTSITSGGITAIIAEAVIGRKTEEMEPVAKPIEAITADTIEDRSGATQDVQEFKPGGEASELDLGGFREFGKAAGGNDDLLPKDLLKGLDPELLAQIYRKRDAALKGEVDTSPITAKGASAKAQLSTGVDGQPINTWSQAGAKAMELAKELMATGKYDGPTINLGDHNAFMNFANNEANRGWGLQAAAIHSNEYANGNETVSKAALLEAWDMVVGEAKANGKELCDPLVFDLNEDGDTDATVDQRGINVDGSTATKWAEKGDGVLAMGDTPIATTDSKGVKHKDAYETLKAEAQYAGIDISKGYLDASDIKTLESKGLTMLVSNGDGTNQHMKPSELGITKMSLGGKAVDKKDAAGNSITTEGSFERNGKSGLVNDMWLKTL